MTEENSQAQSNPASPETHEPATHDTHGETWGDVISQLDGLADALGRWTRAAANDPVNRERAREIKEHVDRMAGTVAEAVEDASESDVGRSFREAAVKTGEAFKVAGVRAADEFGPRVAAAFRVAAERLHQAAERMEYREPGQQADVAESEPAAEPESAPTADPAEGTEA